MTLLDHPTPLVGRHEADVVILGGGLAGLATAMELTRAGRRVAVLEASPFGGEAPGADLGHVATGLSMPYTTARASFGRDHARTLWEWHRENHERLRTVLAELGDECGHRRNGGFLLARDRQEAMDLADSEDALRDDGFPGEFLDHYMLEARFGVRGFAGAYWAADDGEVDPVALLRRMAASVASRGALLFDEGPVVDLRVEGDGVSVRTAAGELRARVAVLAVGVGAGPLLSALAVAGSASLAGHLSPLVAHHLTFSLDEGLSLPSPARSADGRLAFRADRDLRVTTAAPGSASDTAYRGLEGAAAAHLAVSSEPLARWSVALQSTLDGLPLLGPLDGQPVLLLLGLGSLGHSWAFVAARWIAEGLQGREGVPPLLRWPRPPL